MTKLLFVVLAALALGSAEDKPAPPQTAKLTELQVTKMQLLVAREELKKRDLADIGGEQRAWFVDACKAAGIEAPDFAALAKLCEVDLAQRTVTKRASEVSETATKQPGPAPAPAEKR